MCIRDSYMGDLEENRIVYLTPDRKEIKVLASGDGISWPDTFSIHDGYLLSLIHI